MHTPPKIDFNYGTDEVGDCLYLSMIFTNSPFLMQEWKSATRLANIARGIHRGNLVMKSVKRTGQQYSWG